MGLTAINVSKGKGASSGLTAHNEREVDPRNADKERSHLNVIDSSFRTLGATLDERARHVIKESGITRKVQADAVLYCPLLFSGSHDTLTKLHTDPKLMDEWVQDNRTFIEEKFGKANIISFAAHFDEATPHIHCSVVPIVTDIKNGVERQRLTAKELFGPNELKQLHTDYAQAMSKYGLDRGQDTANAKVHHTTTNQFYRDVEAHKTAKMEEINQLQPKPLGAVMGFLTSHKTEQATENKQLKTEIEAIHGENKAIQSEIKAIKATTAKEIEKALKEAEKAKNEAEKVKIRATTAIEEAVNKFQSWFPIAETLQIEKECKEIKMPQSHIDKLIREKELVYSGELFSPGHNKLIQVENVNFEIKQNKLTALGTTIVKMFDFFVNLLTQKEAKRLEDIRIKEEKAEAKLTPNEREIKKMILDNGGTLKDWEALAKSQGYGDYTVKGIEEIHTPKSKQNGIDFGVN